MAKRKIVLQFVFNDDEDLPELSEIKLHKDTNMSRGEREGVAEHWAQSDSFWLEITQDILDVIDS